MSEKTGTEKNEAILNEIWNIVFDADMDESARKKIMNIIKEGKRK